MDESALKINKKSSLNKVKVKAYTPSEIMKIHLEHPELGLAETILLGYKYDINRMSNEEIGEMIIEEYGDQSETNNYRRRVYLAETVDNEGNRKIIGSLYFILWRNENNDKRGKPLFDLLQDKGKGIINLEMIKEGQVLACDVGIVVHPNYHGQGIVKELYKQALSDDIFNKAKPIFIFGQTKTISAPKSRESALLDLGFLTTYAGLPVTEASKITEEIAKLGPEIYQQIRSDRATSVNNEGLYLHYDPADDVLKPGIDESKVNWSSLSPNLRKVFEGIIFADKNRPEGQITFGVLVSTNMEYIK